MCIISSSPRFRHRLDGDLFCASLRVSGRRHMRSAGDTQARPHDAGILENKDEIAKAVVEI